MKRRIRGRQGGFHAGKRRGTTSAGRESGGDGSRNRAERGGDRKKRNDRDEAKGE